jgi:Zn-dependent peptidase ImmA (M78 family)
MATLYVAPPISRLELRNFARRFREKFGLGKLPCFPIVQFLEYVVFSDDWGYTLDIRSRKEMPDTHAETDLQNKIMRIREDIYEGAYEGQGRDRLTLTHELGHVVLHEGPTLSRIDPDKGGQYRTYRDPEWQASAFAGELLMPFDIVGNHTEEMVMKECMVSRDAARYQLNAFKKNN